MNKEEVKKDLQGEDKINAFIKKINKDFDGGIVKRGGRFGALHLDRFSSGIISLDLALGGGWPFGRVCMIAGHESTGKTLTALKAIKSIEEYDHITHKHKDFVEGDKFIAATALFVDLEGTFDLEWAKVNGFNEDRHVVARPETAEQAIDIITFAIRDDTFDLIVIDSIAAMTPSKEIEASADEWQMGLAARLINKAMRSWTASLNKHSQESSRSAPCIICLNQFRVKFGVMFGDPRIMPGGSAQKFAASIIAYTTSAKVEHKTEENALVSMAGVTHKNKTYVPKVNYEFDLYLKDTEEFNKGSIDNIKQLITFGKKYETIIKDGTKTIVDGEKFNTEKEIKAKLKVSPLFHRKLWRDLIEKATGQII